MATSVPTVPRLPVAEVPAARPSTAPQPRASYLRDGSSAILNPWRPALRDASDDVRAAWVRAASMAIDALHNSGWLAGGINQAVAMTVGVGLRLNLKPDIDALGWDAKTASAWSRTVERRFERYAKRECDITGRASLGKLAAQGLRSYFGAGETLALVRHRREPDSVSATKLQLVPAHRLVQADDLMANMVQGVRLDPATGRPVAYRIRFRQSTGVEEDVDIRARDGAGRPQVVHLFDGEISQVRGIAPLAPVMKVLRQFDQLADATLTAALIQTIIAATIKSSFPSEQVMGALQEQAEQQAAKAGVESAGPLAAFLDQKADWYDATKIDLGRHGKIAHLFLGEELDFNRSEHPNDNYEAFAKWLLREIARCLGITFEQLTTDYNGATYSSVRMATEEVWKIVEFRREHLVAPLYQAVFEAWLEDEIEAGRIPFPGGIGMYLIHRAAATVADWRGPVKPTADDLKTARAWTTLLDAGVVTEEMVCAIYGLDWEDVHEQLAREKASRARLGLPPRAAPPDAGAAPPEPPEDPEDEREAA